MSEPAERILVIEAQVKRLELDRAYDNAASERSEDRIYLRFHDIEKTSEKRFDRVDERLRRLELKIAYAAGGIMVLQSMITIGIKVFWPAHS